MDSKYIINKYRGYCSNCNKVVLAGTGLCWKDGLKWKVACAEHYPSEWSSLTSKKKAEQDAYQEALAKADLILREKQAERDALRAKLGIDLTTQHDTKYAQYAYSDVSTWSHTYSGSGTLVEFEKALNTDQGPGLAHSLRSSGGVRVTHIDVASKKVFLHEETYLAD